MLLIAKYSKTLILKTTQYWDGLRMVTDPGGRVSGRVMSWRWWYSTRGSSDVIEWLSWWYSTWGSSGDVQWWGHLLDQGVEWFVEVMEPSTLPGGRV